MSGYSLILKIKRLEEEITKLGLRWRYASHRSTATDLLELVPLENVESLPIYHRDAAIFVGTIDQLDNWLRGVEWARNYDRLLGLSDSDKRLAKETRYLERMTFNKLKRNPDDAA